MHDEAPSRTRFAKREIVRALEALERADAEHLDPWMRVVELEERLEDAREDAVEWRRKYEGVRLLLLSCSDSQTPANEPSGSPSSSAAS